MTEIKRGLTDRPENQEPPIDPEQLKMQVARGHQHELALGASADPRDKIELSIRTIGKNTADLEAGNPTVLGITILKIQTCLILSAAKRAGVRDDEIEKIMKGGEKYRQNEKQLLALTGTSACDAYAEKIAAPKQAGIFNEPTHTSEHQSG